MVKEEGRKQVQMGEAKKNQKEERGRRKGKGQVRRARRVRGKEGHSSRGDGEEEV